MTKVRSLWIAWIEAYVLKGRSFRQNPISSTYSWNSRKLLLLRSLTYRFVEWKGGAKVWKFQGSKYSTAVVWNEIKPKMGKRD